MGRPLSLLDGCAEIYREFPRKLEDFVAPEKLDGWKGLEDDPFFLLSFLFFFVT